MRVLEASIHCDFPYFIRHIAGFLLQTRFHYVSLRIYHLTKYDRNILGKIIEQIKTDTLIKKLELEFCSKIVAKFEVRKYSLDLLKSGMLGSDIVKLLLTKYL
jgi:hypothetical protein